MLNRCSIVFILVSHAGMVIASPMGLSGLSMQGGGMCGIYALNLGFEADFNVMRHVALGPEFTYGFGFDEGMRMLAIGAGGRYYFLAGFNREAQPFGALGIGYMRFDFTGFDGSTGANFGYFRFGGGIDFDIPHTHAAPYVGAGGVFAMQDKVDHGIGFVLGAGLRMDTW